MRLIRTLLLLALVSAGAFVAYSYWSESDSLLRSRAAAIAAETAREQASKAADRATATAGSAVDKLGDRMSDSALTAKIKSKMALDDHVKARGIDVDTSGARVTLTGVVASADERRRAVRLARETEGVADVVDRLQVKTP